MDEDISNNINHFFKFPSIEGYRQLISNIDYYTKNQPLLHKKLNFEGTVKLHGTHADIVYNKSNNEIYFQSRNRILTKDSDNCNFMNYMSSLIENLKEIFEKFVDKYPNCNYFILSGEWCGKGIQSNVALSCLEKMFIIYNSAIYENFEKKVCYDTKIIKDIILPELKIYNIYQFPIFNIEIDFSIPGEYQDKLSELTNKVEDECPVGKYFGVSGTGEGIVWKCTDNNFESSKFWMKIKGHLHSVVKNKSLASTSIEDYNTINEFVNNVVTEQRLLQGLSYLREQNLIFDKKNIRHFIKWVTLDVLKEESDTILKNNLNKKTIEKNIGNVSSKWYIKNLEYGFDYLALL